MSVDSVANCSAGFVVRLSAALLAACASTAPPPVSASVGAPHSAGDPSRAEVSLPALGGWNGTLVLDQGATGIWTCAVAKVFPHYGCPEIVGIDDLGRCQVIWSYSGKWTPVTTLADGKWLGGIVVEDVDPRIDGKELYTGSQQGNLYQVVPYENTLLDNRLIGRIPGFEIHTVIGTDLDPAHPGLEVIVFTSPGRLYVATPRTDGHDGFDLKLVEKLPGRIRDAVVLPARAGGGTEIATIGRHGQLQILSWKDGKPHWSTVFEAQMGMGRVALKPAAPGEPVVLYSTADDGMIRRHERDAGGAWKDEIVYAGPQGPRGICAGRFDADPSVETIAIFGYSKRVELLSRRAGQWSATTIFEDRDKGHWITAGEVDNRNGTDEIVCTGYGGRIVLLSRPPGYALAARSAAVLANSKPDTKP